MPKGYLRSHSRPSVKFASNQLRNHQANDDYSKREERDNTRER